MNTKLRQLKNKFLAWAIKWANVDDNIEEIPFDLPEVVNVLQALGFQLRVIDNLDDKDISLKNGEKGIKVVVTCMHSGQICHLEKPTEDKSCKCLPIADDNTRDAFWEVSATKPSKNQSGTILETGSDLIPQLSKEMILFVSGVTNQTFSFMMNDKYLGSTQSLNNSFLGSPGKSLSKSFDFPNFTVTSPGSSSRKPIRYGSLDAIPSMYSTSKDISRQLDISKTEIVESSQIDSCSNKDFQADSESVYPLIERAHSDLSRVMDLMKRSNLEDTRTSCICESTVNETTDLVSTKAISKSPSQTPVPAIIPKLPSKSKIGVSSSKPTHLTPRASSYPTMVGSTSKLARPQVKSTTKPEISKTKVQESTKIAKLTPKDTPTRSSKYAHIKSTIPKAAPLKKK